MHMNMMMSVMRMMDIMMRVMSGMCVEFYHGLKIGIV